MGKRIISQRRGRGTTTYRSPSHRYVGKASYRVYDNQEKLKSINGKITDIVHCAGHSAPLIEITYEDGTKALTIAPEGVYVNKEVQSGNQAQSAIGNILQLRDIPIGTKVFNIEKSPGDGGKFIRSAGTTATVIERTEKGIVVMLPSKKLKEFNFECRATIGISAASGKGEKPFVKAGNRFHAMAAKNKLYPQTSGVAMNAVDHPFGSGRGRHIGKPKNPSRFAPPGRKVGSIRARRMGKK
ncbi:MAG TPA: 50S ribosomal protein L2 [Candidatus Nanoarchaeia archaeon]|nr:hypothetical protein [uncultured archaeon]AQS34165.1 hypothetical protein [uncultured archaeon]HLC56543.1 50S ribosomal protein L2 [Candidatus Nanoarchaeia archaeon]